MISGSRCRKRQGGDPMQGKQEQQLRLWQAVNLERLVPQNHILRHIDRVPDLSFLRPLVADLYHSQLGRPSYPPELILRMFLLSYLYNLSDVRVWEEVAMHAGFRWFCRLNFDDPVPDRTTLVKIRKRWGRAGLRRGHAPGGAAVYRCRAGAGTASGCRWHPGNRQRCHQQPGANRPGAVAGGVSAAYVAGGVSGFPIAPTAR